MSETLWDVARAFTTKSVVVIDLPPSSPQVVSRQSFVVLATSTLPKAKGKQEPRQSWVSSRTLLAARARKLDSPRPTRQISTCAHTRWRAEAREECRRS